jgi:hypothetical protein
MTEPDDKHTHNIVAVPLVARSSTSTEPQQSPTDGIIRQRKQAKDDDIRVALRTIHSADGDAPNIVDIVDPVLSFLDIAGLTATKEQIQNVAKEPVFKLKRRRRGLRRT